MKSLIIFLILLNLIDQYSFLTPLEKQLYDENKELNDKLKDTIENFEKLKSKFQIVIKENESIKRERDSKNEEIEYVKVINEASDKILKFHSMIEQFKLQKERMKEMNNKLKIDLKEINSSKENINKVYSDIKSDFEKRLIKLTNKISNLEISHIDINKRLYLLNKDIVRNSTENSLLLKTDCYKSNNCNECIQDSNCIWCPISRKCENIESKTCTITDSTCPENRGCNYYQDNFNCEKNNCKWCISLSQCLDRCENNLLKSKNLN